MDIRRKNGCARGGVSLEFPCVRDKRLEQAGKNNTGTGQEMNADNTTDFNLVTWMVIKKTEGNRHETKN